MDGGAWQATVHGVTERRTRLKWLSLQRRVWSSPMVLVVKNPPASAGDRHKRHGFRDLEIPWRKAWQTTPGFLPGNSMDDEFWWATVCGVAESDMTEVN